MGLIYFLLINRSEVIVEKKMLLYSVKFFSLILEILIFFLVVLLCFNYN